MAAPDYEQALMKVIHDHVCIKAHHWASCTPHNMRAPGRLSIPDLLPEIRQPIEDIYEAGYHAGVDDAQEENE